MHPAFSVIFFTTISGAGYGLAALLSLGLLPPELASTKIGFFLALALISIGLLSSTLHLGNPQRAWRAFSQWRTSWLSREGCFAILTFAPLTLQAFLVIFYDEFLPPVGWITAILCFVTVYCTAMIYASLRTVAAWHTGLTPLNYLLFSLASGAVLLMILAITSGLQNNTWIGLTVAVLIVAWSAKWLWAKRTSTIGTGSSSIATATGLGHLGDVRLLERPHMTENYLTREMGFKIARKHNRKLWNISVLLGLVAPIIALMLITTTGGGTGNSAVWLAVIATVSHMIGLFIERWLFFANAKHTVSLYYGG